MRKIWAIAICASLVICNIFCKPIKASSFEDSFMQRLMNLSQSKINEIALMRNDSRIPSCETVKSVTDYAGNAYYVIECYPSGYLIYHAESGQFVELSLSAPSPYLGFENDLVYGGPGCYLGRNSLSGELIDIFAEYVIDETFDNSKAIIDANQRANRFLADIDTSAKWYVEGHSDTLPNELKNNKTSRTPNRSFTYVPDDDYISNLVTWTQMGYPTSRNGPGYGMCGWVACGIAILWHQLTSGQSLISTNNVSGGVYTSDAFTFKLRSYGIYDDTWAIDLASAVNQYAAANNKPLGASLLLLPSASISSIISNQHKPVVAGGNVWSSMHNDFIDHYMVIYGYSDSYYVCHYGYQGYSVVLLLKSNATLGDGVTFSVNTN
ncbi:MAG: hypothetical protein J5493_02915 [Lachnospiraceae bacterium]|nr:hypothetical protein [Lachnospiraceae bacterium]